MNYFLDTNIIIYALKDPNSKVWGKLKKTPSMCISIPDIVLAEIEYGCRKSNNYKKNKEQYDKFTLSFNSYPFCGRKTREAYGKIRSDLEKIGKPIGNNDALIAATVISEGGILVTHNTKEFSRIKDLKIEDWTL